MRRYWIYIPSIVFLFGGVILPQFSHDLVGRMNAREFAIFLEIWWTILAAAWHIVRWLITPRQTPNPHGFEVLLPNNQDH